MKVAPLHTAMSPVALESLAARHAGRVIGVEREYTVTRAGEAVDARPLLAAATGLGAALDPGDRRARRGPSGGAVTADGVHAEVATPPVPLRPGCTHEVLAHAAAGEAHLRRHLPPGHDLEGYSTHINIEVDDRHVARVARRVAHRLAVPLMLALDRRHSPGILVRPRHGRLEIGGEFCAGDQLRAAVALTVAVTLLAERRRRERPRLPRGARLRPERAVERFGWYVDRKALGPDLYAAGRATPLGGASAGDLLGQVWRTARPGCGDVLAAEEVALVDRLVDGSLPLPLELPIDRDGATAEVPDDRRYDPRRSGSIEVTVESATWWKAVLRVAAAGRTRWLVVPGRALDAVLDAVDAGALQADLEDLLFEGRTTHA